MGRREMVMAIAAVFTLAGIVRGGGSPAVGSSPASPAAVPPPRYTQISVNAAANVVGRLTLRLTDRGVRPQPLRVRDQ